MQQTNRPVFGQEVPTTSPKPEYVDPVLQALTNTDGYSLMRVKRGGRRLAMTGDQQHRLELWFDDDELGTARVMTIFKILSRRG